MPDAAAELPPACPTMGAEWANSLNYVCWACMVRIDGSEALYPKGKRDMGLCAECEEEILG